MMNDVDDINDYLPSILNPRVVKKNDYDITLTQRSNISKFSLSLKKKGKTNLLKKSVEENLLCKKRALNPLNGRVKLIDQPELKTTHAIKNKNTKLTKKTRKDSLNISGISSFSDFFTQDCDLSSPIVNGCDQILNDKENSKNNKSCTDSSATDLYDAQNISKPADQCSTVIKPKICFELKLNDCQKVNVTTKHTSLRRINYTNNDNVVHIVCDLSESTNISVIDSDLDENMNELESVASTKRSSISVNLEIKKRKLAKDQWNATEDSKVLYLNINAVEKLSHVIVQPPNYSLVKRQITNRNKFNNQSNSPWNQLRKIKNNVVAKSCDSLKQTSIKFYLKDRKSVSGSIHDKVKTLLPETIDFNGTVNGISSKVYLDSDDDCMIVDCHESGEKYNDIQDMSKKSICVPDTIKCDSIKKPALKAPKRDSDVSPRKLGITKAPSCDTSTQPGPASRHLTTLSAHTPKKNVESISFSLPVKAKSNKNAASTRTIPPFKVVAGTPFAVDAFSYGDIPNIKHYFLTHFHSDHYSGLKRTFTNNMYCSKITADLCMSRLGVNPKYINIISTEETVNVEGVHVTAVDANHCPGAVMLLFTLANGKTILHTGDFRASCVMESYPIFWNRDVHTIYLDTTYCNPRYDFPTQDQSLEMALYLLRQKKMTLEKIGKKFSSVLIVCGTYTIGKEKFFLGMARRVGCAVWACPEKDRVLQVVEGRSFNQAPPQACQMHVVPMRDLTHEKLRSYLDSLQGAFTEVVAFKPSGWENGKNATTERDLVTIHGIPYSEHSSFSEMIRFVKFLQPKLVIPTVEITGGIKTVQKYFPCPLSYKEGASQTKVSDFFSIQNRQHVPAVT